MQMQADLRLAWGGEDVPKLVERLRSAQPGACLSIQERHEDGTAALLRWEHLCFALWKGFLAVIRSSWARDAAESAIQDASFVVLDDDGKRIGSLQGTMEVSGWRHLVDGVPIHCGEALDLLLPDGAWLHGRYEMDKIEDGLPVALFYTRAYRGDLIARITDRMVVRIPTR